MVQRAVLKRRISPSTPGRLGWGGAGPTATAFGILASRFSGILALPLGGGQAAFPEFLRLAVEGDQQAVLHLGAGVEQGGHAYLTRLEQGKPKGPGGQRGKRHAGGAYFIAEAQAGEIGRR